MEVAVKKVLDHGKVMLLDIMGNEATIVDSARISTSRPVDSFSVESVRERSEKDVNLIKYLQRNKHGTPFEHVVMRWYIKAPLFIVRQWMRHRIGTYSEASMRYRPPSEGESLDAKYYTPSDLPEDLVDEYRFTVERAFNFYNTWYTLLWQDGGNTRLREMLRGAIPMAAYTEMIWTVNLRSMMNFLSLRTSEHAQYEMQEYGKAVLHVLSPLFPNIDLTSPV